MARGRFVSHPGGYTDTHIQLSTIRPLLMNPGRRFGWRLKNGSAEAFPAEIGVEFLLVKWFLFLV